ncbi:hypothetical protein [Paenibacillus wulumuqiensis]|uniref:hypothetical protein n=1 Tax=Paenibacillus wulumuqiensis TaxID=1567107 RepID=UPI00190FE10F|nr:hypothetical protein [Paenibacillus wulumuqiensis]
MTAEIKKTYGKDTIIHFQSGAKYEYAATLEGAGTFVPVSGCQSILQMGGQQITYTPSALTDETALILIEVYK